MSHEIIYLRLKGMWDDFAHRLKLDPHFSGATWQLLVGLYHIPDSRSYHTLTWHIYHMLQDFYEFKAKYPNFTDRWDEIEWAIWFHDVYMKPQSVNNEYNSMQLAAQLTAVHTPLEFYAVSHCILATTHCMNTIRGSQTPKLFRAWEKLICDLDLLGFTHPMDIFKESQRRLRAEYPWVTDVEYKEGRASFLKQLMARGYIFLLKEFREMEPLAIKRIEGIINGDYD